MINLTSKTFWFIIFIYPKRFGFLFGQSIYFGVEYAGND